jgi:hypothetical protein
MDQKRWHPRVEWTQKAKDISEQTGAEDVARNRNQFFRQLHLQRSYICNDCLIKGQ